MTERAERAYAELLRGCRERALLASCSTLLEWDEDTVMPAGGFEHRSSQRALIAGLEHQRWLEPGIGELLSIVEESALVADPLSPAAVNVRELRRQHARQSKLDRALVEELARTCTIAQHHYARAQEEDDFSIFAPWLEKVLSLKREEASALSDDLYDALLDEYEPGIKSAELTKLFSALSAELKPLITAISRAREPRPKLSLLRPIPVAAQRKFLELATNMIGFDYRRGRLDESQHPFTSLVGPGDVRITTRFIPGDFGEGFFCGLHELGHGLYDQALPGEHFGTPYGEPISLGMHEAQARLWENIVGRRYSFWEYFLPHLKREFSPLFDDAELGEMFRAVNRVEPSLRRVRADEVTYNLHVIIRFELEQKLITRELAVNDLREAWNAAYARELGLAPKSDREGLLQDGHWSAGMFGYFPTYTLGNMIAAQLYAAAEKNAGPLDPAFARGDFSGLLGWLRTHVHARGGQLSCRELVARATGEPLAHRALIEGLKAKASAVYGIS
jgi:carboxypeptidase Taq